MKRMFWFGAGVAAGVALTRKVNETAKKATPTGAAEQIGGAVRELAGAVGAFGADVRAGMQEREDELQDVIRSPETVQVRRFDAGADAQDRRARRAGR